MGELGRFILSLFIISAATAAVNGVIPDGGTKKYVTYLISLALLVALLSPLKSVISSAPDYFLGEETTFDSVEVFANANSIVARHIAAAVRDKFALTDTEVVCKYDGENITVRVKRHIGIIAGDIEAFVINNFGILAEVDLFE